MMEICRNESGHCLGSDASALQNAMSKFINDSGNCSVSDMSALQFLISSIRTEVGNAGSDVIILLRSINA